MAYAQVGSVGTVATVAATSITPSFAQATTAGNLLIGWFASGGSGAAPSTASSGWSMISSGGAGDHPVVFYKPNCGAGETAPTFNSTSSISCSAALAEFSGGATSSPLDQTAINTLSTTSPVVATCSVADSAVGELLVSCGLANLTMASTITTSHTYNNGASSLGNLNNDATSAISHFRFAYGITTGNAAADQVSMAITGGTVLRYSVSVTSFLLPSVAAAAIPDVGMALTVT